MINFGPIEINNRFLFPVSHPGNLIVLKFFQYGEIEEMNVCDNLGDHLVGNVYVKVSFNFFVRVR